MKTFYLRERRHLEALKAFLEANWEAMSKTKTPMQVECKPESHKRTSQANRRYWAILNQIESDVWVEGRQYSAQVWHEAAKRRFLGCIDIPGGGMIAVSSADLSSREFSEYTDKVEAWAATEFGLSLQGAA